MRRVFKKYKKNKPPAIPGVLAENTTPSTSTVTTDGADITMERIDWAELVANILYDISGASPILGPLKATSALILRGLETTRNAKRNHSAWISLELSLEQQRNAIDEIVTKLGGIDRDLDLTFQTPLKSYIEVIDEVHSKAVKAPGKPKTNLWEAIRQSPSAVDENGLIASLKAKLDGAYQDFFIAASNAVAIQIAKFAAEVREVRREGERLTERAAEHETSDEDPVYDATLALLYGIDAPLCTAGTRTSILAGIRSWASDKSIREKVFWLKDAAGTGKTTVAATLVREFITNQTLAGRFFFTPNSIVGTDISQFCAIVAKDMAHHVPPLRNTITATLKDSLTLQQGFQRQFQRLIVEPLKTFQEDRTLILVIDALDNCHPDGRELLLESILENISSINKFKVLITSRPISDIVDILSSSSLVRESDVQLFDITNPNLADVTMYVEETLPKLSTHQRKQIVDYSGGLFIVASTICSLVRWNRRAAELLDKPIHAEKSKGLDHLYLNMDMLYLQILKQAVMDQIGELAHAMMLSVLQIIIIVFQPVSINTIKRFLPKDVEVAAFVEALGALLKDGAPDRPIKVIHPTFREFLAEEARANGFLVSNVSSHAITAIGCLDELDRSLDHDILRLCRPLHVAVRNTDVAELERKVERVTSAATRYASSYWTYHVAASLENPDVWLRAITFLSTKLLNWVELMSWRESVGVCIQGLAHLRGRVIPMLLKKESPIAKTEVTKIWDAYQFLLQHQSLIQNSALQAYSAALAFTPQSSFLFEGYRERYATEMPKICMADPIQWINHDILTGHLTHVEKIEFSPDGNRLASRDADSVLKLWDTNSGASVGYPFESNERIAHMTFSNDSGRIAFSTQSSKVYIWDSATGKRLLSFSEMDAGELVQLAFSPTSPIIIAAFAQSRYHERKAHNSLRLWSSLDGSKVGETMPLGGGALCFAVSPDGLRVAVVSKHDWRWTDGVTTLWSLTSYSKIAEYEMPEVYYKLCVSFSPRGNRFVTWDQQGNLYLRDGMTGSAIHCNSKHENGIIGLHFSPDGEFMASYGYNETTLRLWDAVNGTLKCQLAGHIEEIRVASFSQDGKRLASISLDQTIKVWDLDTGKNMESFFTGYTGNISDPVLSVDWSKLATVSIAHQINLYDVNAGTMRGSEKKSDDMNFATPSVAFSPNGEVMACGYSDLDNTSTFGLWSVKTCDPIVVPVEGHSDGIICVAFSPCGDVVASVSRDQTVRLWDASAGSPICEPLPFDNGEHVLFSPNGRFVAASSAKSIEVWYVDSRRTFWRTERTGQCSGIAFSPDHTRLAGGEKGRICTWELAAGASTTAATVSEIESDFHVLSFGPRSDSLASVYSTKIRLWKIGDTVQMVSELSVKAQLGLQLGISYDGVFLAYGSSIWDINSLESPKLLELQQTDTFDWNNFPNSLLSYNDGWIYTPYGRLVPIPSYLCAQFDHWYTCGLKVVVWTQNWTPVVIDCSSLLTSRTSDSIKTLEQS